MITSKQNALVKEARSLESKKFRDSLNRYAVEGVKMINEAFLSGQEVLSVICTEKCLDKLNLNGFEPTIVSDQVFDYISGEKSPQGAMAILKKPQSNENEGGSCLLLDGVSDPGNVGTIIRTMACAGYKKVYLTPDSADPFSPKAVRSSMSGIYHVNVIYLEREKVKEVIGLPVVVADMHGKNVFEGGVKGDFCLVIGNEAHGVSETVRSLASSTVKIPMQEGMESLNAGVSAGILMYALKNSN
jgi:TrmH family RNA methyltransferase